MTCKPMVLLNGCLFIVYSEQLPPRKFGVSSIYQEKLTPADCQTFIELAAHVGTILTPGHAQMVSKMLENGQPWQFIEDVWSQAYERKQKICAEHAIQYYFPHEVRYQVGTDCRLLMCCSLREPFLTDGTDVDTLMRLDHKITHHCDAYRIGLDDRLHVERQEQQKSKFVFDANEFPKL